MPEMRRLIYARWQAGPRTPILSDLPPTSARSHTPQERICMNLVLALAFLFYVDVTAPNGERCVFLAHAETERAAIEAVMEAYPPGARERVILRSVTPAPDLILIH